MTIKAPDYATAAAEYERRWNEMTVNAKDYPHVTEIAKTILADKRRYQSVWLTTNAPWVFVGLIHYRESDLNWHTHLANGDSLNHRTIHDPRGRIPHKNPPFTWEDAAIDALECRGLHHIKTWSFAQLCYQLEAYNGWGYRPYDIPSPYLWAGSSEYKAGKYTRDGHLNRHYVDEQLGALVVLKVLMDLDKSIQFPSVGEHVPEALGPVVADLPKAPATPGPEATEATHEAPKASEPAPHESLLAKIIHSL